MTPVEIKEQPGKGSIFKHRQRMKNPLCSQRLGSTCVYPHVMCVFFDACIHVAAADQSPELDPIKAATIVQAQCLWTVHYTDFVHYTDLLY